MVLKTNIHPCIGVKIQVDSEKKTGKVLGTLVNLFWVLKYFWDPLGPFTDPVVDHILGKGVGEKGGGQFKKKILRTPLVNNMYTSMYIWRQCTFQILYSINFK